MFKGSMVAIATPMLKGGEVDYEAYERLINFHLKNQTDALVPVGTTGESATLDHKEHCEVLKFVVEKVGGKLPVIAGTGANSTSEAIILTKYALEAGADACLLVTPYYNKPSQEGLYQHYKLVAKEVQIPIVLYNVPGRTACDMLPSTVKRFLDIDNIVGIKEAIGDLKRIEQLLDVCNDKISIISGDDPTAMETILLGGKGVITVTGNIAPTYMHQMCEAALKGNREEAEKYNNKMKGLYTSLFIESNPIPVKCALYKMGLIEEGIRLPLTWLSREHEKNLEITMIEADIKI
ncbi:MAG: 4-hydroxy-tetrahydrodipicolinate synthase [Pseudomonadota bacterium]|nr:4-hydroxy-tetrahydrodipicolinate synthase [Pseudomonadota bacterium]